MARCHADGPVDVVLDILAPVGSAAQVRAAVTTVRPHERIVLMGGVTGQLGIPYSWVMRNNVTIHGQWMYPRAAVGRMISMIRSGQIASVGFTIGEFDLDEANDVVAHAAANAGPFTLTVLRPNL